MSLSGKIKFPCSFPVKVMGLNIEEFQAVVLSIFRKHVGEGKFSCTQRASSSDKYLSLTVTFTAESRDQLDALYEELNAHELVLMTL